MSDFRVGYLYSLSPVHCGGEGDMGNVLDIVRESHTNFPYIPGSSLRGKLRNETALLDEKAANKLFGKELETDGSMGVHQVWFGDARLLWIPMRILSLDGNKAIFTWVSCHSLIRDHAIVARKTSIPQLPDWPVGTTPGKYLIADAHVTVADIDNEQDAENLKQLINSKEKRWPEALKKTVHPAWKENRIILSDSDFQILMEHSLWTQIRNKIKDEETNKENLSSSSQDNKKQDENLQSGGAGIFWTDICIPRDTIFYYTWGYRLLKTPYITEKDNEPLKEVLSGLVQVGGQANVGRGWVQNWVNEDKFTPLKLSNTQADKSEEVTVSGSSNNG